MGFAPHINSWRSVPEKATELPTREFQTYAGELKSLNYAPSPLAIAILLPAAGISFLGTLLYIIWIIMGKYRPTMKD